MVKHLTNCLENHRGQVYFVVIYWGKYFQQTKRAITIKLGVAYSFLDKHQIANIYATILQRQGF